MKKNVIFVMLLLVPALIFSAGTKEASEDGPTVLKWYSHASSLGATEETIVEAFNAENPNIRVEIIELPEATNDKLQALLIALQSGDSSIDFFNADVTWTATFASAGLIEPLDTYFSKAEQSEFLPGTIQAASFRDKIWGMPFRTDAGVLYYRADLLEKYGKEVPTTYTELFATAQEISAREGGDMYALVGSLANGEGMTCNAVEWFYSNGGEVIDSNGTILIDSPQNVEILKMMTDAYEANLLPEGVLSYGSGDARASMFQGKQVFMRAWPKAFAMGQDASKSQVAGKLGVSPLPRGPQGTMGKSVVGGWQLFLNKYSENKDEAVKFMKFYASEYAQKLHALNDSYLPARRALYEDGDILEKYPHYSQFPAILETAVARPQSPYYSEISSILSAEVQNAMKGSKSPALALADAQKAMEAVGK
ncbi:ABC transporter substrate-binding protein [uncultured Sphaerochaeta sp.]|uniref:ABC transporter substrate-binding protein n=1 Tax=uncultured Sphaerochaeta sp. TaxID=886478 RepID=UPI002AA6E347|nr:ABC transporter substrate-binding protein [uncultured Sphaerochaeta sp.]